NTLPQDNHDTKDMRDNYDITIKTSGNHIYAKAERTNSVSGWFGNNHASISFVVYTPQEMSCRLSTSGGSIELAGVRGGQKLETSGGSVRIADVRGQTEARTSGGSIKIEGYAG